LQKFKRFVALFVAAWLASCARYPLNDELKKYDDTAGYRFSRFGADGQNTDSIFVCLAFSGGGTRAAALSYGVLKKLAEIKIEWEGKQKSLLDEVDCISSVSGGSFTAAYYALFRGRVFSEFPDKFLYRNIQKELISKLFNPINLARILSPYFSRIDLAAELYHDTVFEKQTFAELLASNRRPFLILNATNLALGERFEFTQDQFDRLGSDLAGYPIARAVAASSAFPFLLSPLSLKNQPKPENYQTPLEFKNALQDFERNRRRYEWAKNQVLYEDKENHPYVHLMDGGLADNLGVRFISDSFRRGTIRRLINNDKIKRLVIVVVNAGTQPPEDLDKRESPPGIATVAYKVATISMDNYTFETIEMMKELRDGRLQTQRTIDDCQGKLKACPSAKPLDRLAGGDLEPFVVDINFESLAENPQRRDYFLSLPTSFKLERQQVDNLIAVGGELLEKSQEFKSFMESLKP
jgi:predicted acylesterase/phospholipase RssA